MGVQHVWREVAALWSGFLTPEVGAAMALASGFPVCVDTDDAQSPRQQGDAGETEDVSGGAVLQERESEAK
jgi:hypothetical protein